MRGKCSPAPTLKSQWVRGLAQGTHTHGQVLPWGIRPALYLGCYKTCFCYNSLTLDWGSKCLLNILNFLKSVLNLPSMECNQFNHFPPWAVTSFSLKWLAAFFPLLSVKGNLCIVNEDHPRCNVPRTAIKACPGRGRVLSWAHSGPHAISHWESGRAVPFSPQDFCSPCVFVYCCHNTGSCCPGSASVRKDQSEC